jgi:hypothetical protein
MRTLRPRKSPPLSGSKRKSTEELRASGIKSQPVSGSKRKSSDVNQQSRGSGNKKRLVEVPLKQLKKSVQCAVYGASMLSNKKNVSHAITLLTIGELSVMFSVVPQLILSPDDHLYIWYYDRQGPVLTHGINFVQDLPYLLVLLFAFQRFTTTDWGTMVEFDTMETSHVVRLDDSTTPLDVIASDSASRRNFTLIGRCTRIYNVISLSKDPRDTSRTLTRTELVLKISWPETSRKSEKDVIGRATQCKKAAVQGHLPDLVWSGDLLGYSTGLIRDQLCITSGDTRTRVARVILFRRLHPITELKGDAFWDAFWQIFRCEQILPLMLTPTDHSQVTTTSGSPASATETLASITLCTTRTVTTPGF